MARYQVVFEGWVTSVAGDERRSTPPDEIEQLLDGMMDILMDAPGVGDATYSGTLARGAVEISVTVEADDSLSAHVLGNSAIRAAAHGAGAGTPGWDLDWCSISLIRADSQAEPALAS